jgi:hypothetical protein
MNIEKTTESITGESIWEGKPEDYQNDTI